MKEQLRINLNDTVKVKLTRLGKAIYRHRYDQINACAGEEVISPMDPKEDEEGYTSFQLWDFIDLYGRHIRLGHINVIEPLDIVCEVDIPETRKKDKVDVRYTDADHAWIDGKQWISLRRFQEAVWAERKKGIGYGGNYYCDKCGAEIHLFSLLGDWRYCPNCGEATTWVGKDEESIKGWELGL